jgi:hypothetical protein
LQLAKWNPPDSPAISSNLLQMEGRGSVDAGTSIVARRHKDCSSEASLLRSRRCKAVFAPGYKLEPYWWDATPRPVLARQALPGSVDVAIVGSGYTGLHAALELARAGRSVVVLDAGDAGFGCSSRNGGQISSSIKPGLDELVSRYGEKTGRAILRTGHDALQWIGEFVAREKIDCDFKVPGRFHAAHNERQFDKLVRAVENQPRGFEVPVRVVSRSEQHDETGHGRVLWRRGV